MYIDVCFPILKFPNSCLWHQIPPPSSSSWDSDLNLHVIVLPTGWRRKTRITNLIAFITQRLPIQIRNFKLGLKSNSCSTIIWGFSTDRLSRIKLMTWWNFHLRILSVSWKIFKCETSIWCLQKGALQVTTQVKKKEIFLKVKFSDPAC